MELPDFSKIFHQSSKDHAKGAPAISQNPNEWPEEFKTTYYKAYPRLPKIELGNPTVSSSPLAGEDKGGGASPLPRPPHQGEGINADLFRIIKNRKSQRDFTRGYITKQELSILLKYSCGNTSPMGNGRQRRAQPSGGARFPIEVYPIVFRSAQARTAADKTRTDADTRDSSVARLPQNDDETVPNRVSSRRNSVWDEPVKAGLYHYNVKDHALDVLWDREFSDEDINGLFSYPWVKDAWGTLVMTAVFWRNQNRYGERGYRMILQESGHIGQNVYLISEALGLKCCALDGIQDENLEKLIDIDGVTESVVYALAVGR